MPGTLNVNILGVHFINISTLLNILTVSKCWTNFYHKGKEKKKKHQTNQLHHVKVDYLEHLHKGHGVLQDVGFEFSQSLQRMVRSCIFQSGHVIRKTSGKEDLFKRNLLDENLVRNR